MTVAELIKQLQECQQDCHVLSGAIINNCFPSNYKYMHGVHSIDMNKIEKHNAIILSNYKPQAEKE